MAHRRRQTTKKRDQTIRANSGSQLPDHDDQVESREATNALLDQTIFTLDEEAFARFQAMLDSPSQPNDQLRALLLTKAPWD